MKYLYVIQICLVLLGLLNQVEPHGHLANPPARNVMWRNGYSVPASYSYNSLNCGGMYTQHSTNGGKCGICGDGFNSVRKHEVGGPFASGIISRTYKAGATIDVDVTLTANHKGYFEFKLCAYTDASVEVTQECLDSNLLSLADGSMRYLVDPNQRKIELKVKLPDAFVCDHCVFQWKYKAGNSWGSENGKSGIGLGPQEEYANCADIKIEGSSPSQSTLSPLPSTLSPLPSTLSPLPSTLSPLPTSVSPSPFPPGSSGGLKQLTPFYMNVQNGQPRMACALYDNEPNPTVMAENIEQCLNLCKPGASACPAECFCVQ